MSCPICLWKPRENVMPDVLLKNNPLRWGPYDNQLMYEAGKNLHNVTDMEKRAKVKASRNISEQFLFRIHSHKKHCGLMHGESE
jgi:hypothetical protein